MSMPGMIQQYLVFPQMVSHTRTNIGPHCLTSVIWRELMSNEASAIVIYYHISIKKAFQKVSYFSYFCTMNEEFILSFTLLSCLTQFIDMKKEEKV